MCLCTEIFAFEEPRSTTKSARVPFPSGACLMRKAKVRANLARRWSPSDSVETAFLTASAVILFTFIFYSLGGHNVISCWHLYYA